MNRKIVVATITLLVLTAIIAPARAQMQATIEAKDSYGNSIDGQTVPINTLVYLHAYYEDSGGAQATATLKVYFNDGTGFTYKTTLLSGILNSGDTITRTYQMNEIGEYQFRFTCAKIIPDRLAMTSLSGELCEERVQARTNIQLVVPEPGTIATLIMALSVLGIIVAKRTHRI